MVEEKDFLSHVWLFTTSWTIQSRGFSRPEYWSGQSFPSPGDLPNPGIEPRSPTLQVQGTREARGYKPQGYGTHFFPGNEILLMPRYPGNVLSIPTEISISYQHVIDIAIQSLSPVWLFATPWTAAHQASLSFTISWSYTNSCPSSRWCHPTISSSVIPFSSCPPSFPASGSFPMSWLSASGGQSIGASASASVLSVNIQGWLPLGLTVLISLQSKAFDSSQQTVENSQR